MKIILTENQMSAITSLKKAFFKYWDKFGGEINDDLLKLFSSQNHRIDIFTVRGFLRQWLGNEDAHRLAKEIIEKNPHKIGEDNFMCGGYNFDFDLKIAKEINDEREELGVSEIYVNVYVDAKNPKASVNLIMIGGEEHQLYAALKNEDYGWEVENEIQECILDYIENEITNKTGVPVTIYKLDIK